MNGGPGEPLPPLTADEARRVEEAWQAASGPAPGRRLQALGCLVAFGGMAILTLTPALGNFVALESGTAYGILALAVVLLAGGALLGLTGAGRSSGAERAAVDAAVDRLREAHGGHQEQALAAAAVLLARLRDAGPEGARADLTRRLGPALDDLRRVRAHLVSRGLVPRE